MAETLKPALEALHFTTEAQQVAVVKLLHAAGAYGRLEKAPELLSDAQATALLNHVKFDDADQALTWLHNVTQAHFLRSPSGAERHEVSDPPFARAHREALLEMLDAAGLTQAVEPQRRQYDTLMLLGAMESTVDERLETVKKLWDDGVRFRNIAVLGGERPLNAEREPSAATVQPKTELAMMVSRLSEHADQWPEGLSALPVTLVNTPMRKDGQGKVIGRPNTRDTVQHWLDTAQPDLGSTILAVSNQPHVRYQQAAVDGALPGAFTLETVGAGVTDRANTKIIVALDAMAREIDAGLPQIRARMHENMQRKAHLDEVVMVNPDKVVLDPSLQFRLDIDKRGVTTKFAEEYNVLKHGDPIFAFEDENGVLFAVDGFHRTSAAQASRAKGNGPEAIPARILRASDGYTKETARLVGAHINFIKDRSPDLTEAAAVFHEEMHGRVKMDLLPKLKLDGNLRVSYTAGQLSEPAFALVKNGEVPVEVAASVAEQVKQPEQQLEVMQATAMLLKAQDKTWVERVARSNAGEPQFSLGA